MYQSSFIPRHVLIKPTAYLLETQQVDLFLPFQMRFTVHLDTTNPDAVIHSLALLQDTDICIYNMRLCRILFTQDKVRSIANCCRDIK